MSRHRVHYNCRQGRHFLLTNIQLLCFAKKHVVPFHEPFTYKASAWCTKHHTHVVFCVGRDHHQANTTVGI